MSTGVNLGSGQWSHPGWMALDEEMGTVLTKSTVLTCPDTSLDNAYSSHFFEHINDDIADSLFKEVCRVLRPGGHFRILVPDFELLHQKYLSNDAEFFHKVGFSGRPDWKKNNVESTLENILLHFMSNYDYGEEGEVDFYRGPPIVENNEAVEKIRSLSTVELCSWIHKKIPTYDPRVKTQHINFWNYEKFHKMLTECGFSEVLKSSHMSSMIEAVTTTQSFDALKDRSLVTLYIEAKK